MQAIAIINIVAQYINKKEPIIAQHKSNLWSYISLVPFAQIQSVGSCIEFLSFLLRNHQINVGKEVQVSDRNYDILVLFR